MGMEEDFYTEGKSGYEVEDNSVEGSFYQHGKVIPLLGGEYKDEDIETLSDQERLIADRMLLMAVNNIQELGNVKNFVNAMMVKKFIERLLEKLQENDLPEEAVGVIAEGVWTELNKSSGVKRFGKDQVTKSDSQAEQKIVRDILRRLDGKFFIISGLWKNVVRAVGPQASSKIIRVVAREAWPEVRRRLGV